MRPTGWAVLGLDTDPAPGEPGEIRRVAHQVRAMATVATTGDSELAGVVTGLSGNAWVGATGDEFRESIGQRYRPALDLVGDSLTGASAALATWANDVEDAQRQVDHLLRQATDATADIASAADSITRIADAVDRAQRDLDAAEPGSPEAIAATRRLEEARSQQSGTTAAVVAAQRRIDAAVAGVPSVVEDYATSAVRAAAALRRSIDDTRPVKALPAPGFWQTAANAALDTLSTVGNGLASFGNAIIQHPDEGAWLLAGLAAVELGGGIEAGGGALDATGVGAVIGVPLNVAGAAVIAAGGVAAGAAGGSLIRHAGSDSATSPFDTDRVMKSEHGTSGGGTSSKSRFGKFTPDEIRAAAEAPDRNGLTEAGRGLQKHSDRAGSKFFGESSGKFQNRNEQGKDLVNEIINDPHARVTVGKNVTEVYDSTGRGIRMSNDGTFMGFVEEP